MDTERLAKSPIGRLTPIPVGSDGETRQQLAYVPDPLPDRIELLGDTWDVITEAALTLGRLDGEGRRLPNPATVVRPSIRTEAITSAALEGTFTTLPQVLQSELFEDDRSPQDVLEVRDHVRAADLGFHLVANGQPVALNMIKRLHRHLLASDERCPAHEKGEIRTRQNFIGSVGGAGIVAADFVPPPAGDALMHGLFEWEKWIHRQDINPLVRTAVGHYQFETLHPFIDGNGRLGRLLAILLLMDEGVLSVPLLTLSPYLLERRDEYIGRLRELSATGDFDPWVRFFCAGLREQSALAIAKVDRLLDVKEDILADLHRRKVRGIAIRIAEDLIGFPYMTPSFVRDRYEVTWQAGSNALSALERAGHLRRIPRLSNRVMFGCDAVLDVVHEA